MVYCHSDDKFFFDQDPLEYFADTCESLDEWPEYLETTSSEKFELSADTILEHALQDHYDECEDSIVDEQGLRDFIDQWNTKQHAVTYWGDSYTVTKITDFPGYEEIIKEFKESLDE
jgi:hypothetical protein